MKKLLLFLVAIISALSASAQDVIVKTDGSTVLCRIVETNGNEIIYLRPRSPIFVNAGDAYL